VCIIVLRLLTSRLCSAAPRSMFEARIELQSLNPVLKQPTETKRAEGLINPLYTHYGLRYSFYIAPWPGNGDQPKTPLSRISLNLDW
jgi:hypothetical protein